MIAKYNFITWALFCKNRTPSSLRKLNLRKTTWPWDLTGCLSINWFKLVFVVALAHREAQLGQRLRRVLKSADADLNGKRQSIITEVTQ